jgi:two-component system sensor histidine kinase AlgZ
MIAMGKSDKQGTALDEGPSFLPDFCNARVIFLVVIMAELLAFILTLASNESSRGMWVNLALNSLFIQWVALGNVIVLCFARNSLQSLQPIVAALGSYGLSLAITLLVSIVTVWLIPLQNSESTLYSYGAFLTRNIAISAIVSAVALRYFYVQHQWKSKIETEARFRIQALQARIRPHFLFNSMNTIASLTRTNPELAEKTVEDLADLFRASLGHRDTIKLDEELEFTRRYINIEQLRLAERLKLEWQVDNSIPSNTMVPALILQPLVENSIYHGIEPQTEGGTVSISIKRNDESLLVNISNPLPRSTVTYRRKGNKMAQENIRQRLKLAYGERSKLGISKQDGKYIVNFTIPIEEKA